MYQKFTQHRNECYNLIDAGENVELLNPSRETVNFVRCFAYAYHVENKLPRKLSGFILN